MRNHKKIVTWLAVMAVVFLACGLPSNSDALINMAAQTVEVELTNIASTPPASTGESEVDQGQPQETAVDTETATVPANTQAPGDTQVPSATPICNLAGFVTDVTVPDGKNFLPGQSFTKTWRLRNDGECTWTSGYDLVFDSGDQMSAPAAKQLTGSTVPPGGTVDVSVNLKAPNSTGTYQAFFKIRDSGGLVFGLNNDKAFWVKIKVVEPTPTPTSGFVIVPPIILIPLPTTLTPVDSGSVRSNGQVLGVPNVGDTSGNLGSQAFIKFDISSIPSNATITKVVANFTNYDTLGNPFSSLGCLRAYRGNWFPLNAGDYTSGLGAVIRWCSAGDITATYENPGLLNAVQNAVGSSAFELRFHFNITETDSDGVADMIRFSDNVKLIISYTTP